MPHTRQANKFGDWVAANVIQILVILCGILGSYVANQTAVTEQARRLDEVEKQFVKRKDIETKDRMLDSRLSNIEAMQRDILVSLVNRK